MNPAPVCPPFWRAAVPQSLTSLQKYWLQRPGALTDGLRRLGELHLQVVREYACGAPPDEAAGLRQPARTPVWVREIRMSINDTPVVAARSLTLLTASHGVWQGMRQLRVRPLADMLYHDPRITRSDFAIARLRAPLAFYVALRQQIPPAAPLFARRSIFWCHGQPLMVAECFLPDFWPLAV